MFHRGSMIASVWWWHCSLFPLYVTPDSSIPPLLLLSSPSSVLVWWISADVSLKAIARGDVEHLKMKWSSWRQKHTVKISHGMLLYCHASKDSSLSYPGCYFGKKWCGMCFIQVKQQTADWADSSVDKRLGSNCEEKIWRKHLQATLITKTVLSCCAQSGHIRKKTYKQWDEEMRGNNGFSLLLLFFRKSLCFVFVILCCLLNKLGVFSTKKISIWVNIHIQMLQIDVI